MLLDEGRSLKEISELMHIPVVVLEELLNSRRDSAT
jgi:hypothetical protein